MTELYFKDPREYIRFEYELRKARRPSYSMRAFARYLSVSPSSLNDFLKARVGMSEERIEKISQLLRWSPQRTEHFQDLIRAKFDRDPGIRQSAQMRARARLKDGSYGLSLEAFKIISDWYHLAILELCTIKNDLNAAQIASELKLKSTLVTQAVARLIKLKLLVETSKGLKPTDDTSHFGDAGSSEAIKTFHAQILDLAQIALQNNEGSAHESQSVIFSVCHQDLEKMHSEIRRATLDILNRYVQTKAPDCIQVMSLQLFPLWSDKSMKSKSVNMGPYEKMGLASAGETP